MEDSVFELSRLIRERRKIDHKITRLQGIIRSTARQSPRSARTAHAQVGANGFTDAVRQVLITYDMWLTPVLIRDLLPTVGFDTRGYKEPLPSIHVILNRLVSGGQVIRDKRNRQGAVYLWAETVRGVPSSIRGEGAH
jgi:hypothetical protein